MFGYFIFEGWTRLVQYSSLTLGASSSSHRKPGFPTQNRSVKSISRLMKLAKEPFSLWCSWISFCWNISQVFVFFWTHNIFQSLTRISESEVIHMIPIRNQLTAWSADRPVLVREYFWFPFLLASSVIARRSWSLPLSSSLVALPCKWLSKWSPSYKIATPSPKHFLNFHWHGTGSVPNPNPDRDPWWSSPGQHVQGA